MLKLHSLAEHAATDLPEYVPRVDYDPYEKTATITLAGGAWLSLDSSAAATELQQWAREAGRLLREAQK